jgi:hypothetical protein
MRSLCRLFSEAVGQIDNGVPLLRRSSAGRNPPAGHCLFQAAAHCGKKSGLHVLLILLLLSAGCGPSGSPQPPAAPAPVADAPKVPPPPPPPPSDADMKKAEVGVGKKGHGYGDEWILTPAASYWRIRERIAFEVQIPHSMQLFKATEGRAPKDNDEFMEKIIKANAIHLPELYEGESYWYDPKTEQLMIKHH